MTPRIGVMTSGGDAQGMNAAVRAIVRTGIHEGAEVFAIREGWQGAIAGGTHIAHLGWSDVSGILNKGGTVIGTARSVEFRTREGQLTAAQNLIQRGIDRLIVIGGDGSLTGARNLCVAWPEYVAELVGAGRVDDASVGDHWQQRAGQQGGA